MANPDNTRNNNVRLLILLTVSYTHLNQNLWLFKKGSCNTQTLLLPTRNIRTTLFDICMITIWHPVNKFIRTGKMAGPLTPVSYTHLDVYKRQGYADCSSLMRDAYKSASGKYIGNTTYEQLELMHSYLYSISSVRQRCV